MIDLDFFPDSSKKVAMVANFEQNVRMYLYSAGWRSEVDWYIAVTI